MALSKSLGSPAGFPVTLGDGTVVWLTASVAVDTAGAPVSAGGGGGAATIADGADVTQGAKADAAWDGASAAPTAMSIWKRMAALLASILTGVNAATPAGENFIGQVGGPMLFPSDGFTTTALTTAWSANQLIANNATAGSVTPLTFANAVRVTGGTASIRRARAKVAADTGFAGQSVILKLYRDAPTLSAGDRATWLTTESSFIGQLSITLDQHFSDFEKGIGSPSVGNEINFAASGGTTIYGLLVSSGTITPQAGSKAITVTLEILSN